MSFYAGLSDYLGKMVWLTGRIGEGGPLEFKW